MTQKWVALPWERYTALREDKDPDDTDTGGLSVDDILTAIPKQNRREAAAILQHIQRSKDISWNSKGELIIHGEVQPRTHILDLLKDSFYQYKNWRPEGIESFYQALAESNLPRRLIRHPERRSLLDLDKNPRPPGVLAPAWISWK